MKLLRVMEELEAEDETFRPLHDLRDMVLPYATELLAGSSRYHDFNEWWLLFEEHLYMDLLVNEHPFRKPLADWEKKWNMPEWIRPQAVSTLAHWATYPELTRQTPLRWDGFILPLLGEEDILNSADRLDFGDLVDEEDGSMVADFLGPAHQHYQNFVQSVIALLHDDCSELEWYPLFESRKDAKQRIMGLIEVIVDAYLDQIEFECESFGMKPERQKYQKGEEQHYRWFIRHVFQGWSYERIADEEGVPDSSTVRKAVKELSRRMMTPVQRNTYFDEACVTS
ncbi:hypothetical protein [Alicyclobacillus sendaiensis]|uniref:hypothetical protein n=1 Tax=Alicyclobacillus sendaiensis TaxID=192387 RepID=UPI0026F43A42|nr:hypothetical protein [Alicyclobacillus sendaiensis]